jgi:hypothetical protein
MQVKYSIVDDTITGLAPRLSLVLHHGQHEVEVSGLVDSGAAVNLLPYPVGLALGAVWQEQPALAPLVGSLGRMEARGLTVFISHPELTASEPVRQVFAWTEAQDAPVLFGQVNFFMEFEVCFYRAHGYFEVHRNKPRE